MEENVLLGINDGKNELIVKSIELIQKAHYQLSVPELQAYSFILKKIDTSKSAFSEISFLFSDILEELEIVDGGWQRDRVKEILKSLRDKSFWFWDKENGVEKTIGLVSNVEIDRENGAIRVQMDDLLIPYILQTQKKVEYPFWYTLGMGEYCIPLYELLSSYLEQGKFSISVEKLRVTLNVHPKKYPLFSEFRRCVLEKAIEKINSVTDIYATAESFKTKKVVTHIIFTVSRRTDSLEITESSQIPTKWHKKRASEPV